jgi:uncharacterized protein
VKHSIRTKLSALRDSGEVKTGRELVNSLNNSKEMDLFPGEAFVSQTPYGNCYLRELSFPLAYRHGNSTLSGLLNCSGNDFALPSANQGLECFNPQQALFLDIETTGLSGGTGTWVFLIGIGWLEEKQFRMRQYFMRRPMEERAMLSHLARTAANYPALITFNGKMFDLPLIQSRQTLTGFKHINPAMHLDLLQFARIFWKKRLSSRALRSIEENILGFKRSDDIPGYEIPAVYFEYLKQGETKRLKKVFQHNVLDILSMATLVERIALLAAAKGVEHPAEALTLGRLCLKAGRTDEGIRHLRSATSTNTPDPLAEEAALTLSFHFKQQGQWREALEIWANLIAKGTHNPTAFVELAKYYEHYCRQYQAAFELTEQALRLSILQDNYSRGSQLSVDALRHRLQRLKRRLSVSDSC